MKLECLRISNFQCFGPAPTTVSFEKVTALIGPNGAGKTAVLQALSRMFAFDPALRKIQKSDFHVSNSENLDESNNQFWIEADFRFHELELDDLFSENPIASQFRHMRLEAPDLPPTVRYRLEAEINQLGEIEANLSYVTRVINDSSYEKFPVSKLDRNDIQLHYLPARRDPASHIAYGINTLLGRILRATRWDGQQQNVNDLACSAAGCLAENTTISCFNQTLERYWQAVHRGNFFKDPQLSFGSNDIESFLRHINIHFSPAHGQASIPFSRLSDGQKSLLYIALVLAAHNFGQAALSQQVTNVNTDKLHPAVFTILAVEEPENSLAPHYLGRIINALHSLGKQDTSQSIIATHAPSILKRITPEQIRYLRLSPERTATVKTVTLPPNTDEAHKFVRQAVMAYPEVFFARLVVLGEGDSELIVLPKLFQAKGMPVDHAGVVIAPLGGRHVNHFWRLLTGLEIPFVTLLDLDVGRYQGGWGRLHYAYDKMEEYSPESYLCQAVPRDATEAWQEKYFHILDCVSKNPQDGLLTCFTRSNIFYSTPLDLDFLMLEQFSSAYGIENIEGLEEPSQTTIKSVLGKRYSCLEQYSTSQKALFAQYHKLFKLGSKPAAHLQALAKLTDEELATHMPEALEILIAKVQSLLGGIPE
ncbi:ATP-dependent nuclease [Oleidesulfovibrio alaskensis]|uniref:ATP-dependent nuclease n=1 Tax=Oleidesulfovibrio alaskensis TaxID=58180 RepID=UPI0004201CE9|nr:AAA family ATPase [Oleidesulfovibrio alaskensis]